MRRILALLLGAAMLAAACSGEATEETTDTSSTTTAAPADDGDDGAGTDDDDGTGGEDGEFSFPTFVDDRGEPFTSFQESFERNDPFSSLDEFCVSHPAAENPEATGPGIEADSIQLHHLRQKLEDLAGIGFGVPVGEPAKMFDVFVDVINTQCGGIRGRTIDLGLSEFSNLAADPEAEQQAGCLDATEDRSTVIALNSTGFQGASVLCLTEDHDTAFITTQGLNDDFYDRSGGRLLTTDEGLNESMTLLAEKAAADGLLDGASIGIAYASTPGQPEVARFLADELTRLGFEPAVVSEVGCNGSICGEGLDVIVRDMIGEGVDAVFPILNIISLPNLVSEMVAQGYEPGDVRFFNSRANSQDGDLVSSKVVAFGGESAGALYNGAFIVSSGPTGDFHFSDEVPAFNAMCLQTYADNGGEAYDYYSLEDNTPAGMVAQVCSEVRLAARAIWAAGENPTREQIHAALADIGPYDANGMVPSAFTAGDSTGPLAVQTLTFTYPCEIEGGAFDENDTCILMNGDWYTP